MLAIVALFGVLLLPLDGRAAPQRQESASILITEFMASPNSRIGSSALLDEDGDASDWIELHNAGDQPVDLSGWSLTDRAGQLNRWTIPAGTTIDAGDYLVIFASGKDRRQPDGRLHTDFSLKREGEYLGLTDGSGRVVASFGSRYPTQYTGVSYGYAETSRATDGYGEIAHYMLQPTPGLPNGSAHGPVIRDVSHTPAQPAAGEDLVVAATVESEAPLTAMTLSVRFGFGAEQNIPMRDVGGGRYTATVSTRDLPPGTLVRYAVTAGRAHESRGYVTSRWPLPCYRSVRRPASEEMGDGTDRSHKTWLPLLMAPLQAQRTGPDYVRCPDYLGTVMGAEAQEAESDLAVLHWYVPHDPVYGWEWYREAFNTHLAAGNPAWSFRDTGTRATLYYAGALYDNVYVKLGGAGSLVFAKKELEFEFNRDHELYLRGTEVEGIPPSSRDFDIINITTTASDESYVRQPLAWRAYAVAGVPASISFPLRLQEGGEFFSVATFVEQPDTNYLRRYGLSKQGTFYKSHYNSMTREHFDPTLGPLDSLRQIRPRDTDRDDALRAFLDGINPDPAVTGTAEATADRARVTAYVLDNVDVPALINYLAVRTVLDDYDTTWHNFFLYQHPETDANQIDQSQSTGSGEWRFVLWDKDQTLPSRQLYVPSAEHPFFGAVGYAERPNALFDAVIRSPMLQAMYLQRLATVRDLLLGPDGGPNSWLGRYAGELSAAVAADAQLDSVRWTGDAIPPTDRGVAVYDPTRLPLIIARRWEELAETGAGRYGDLIPASHADVEIIFGKMMAAPVPGAGAAVLINCGPDAVDLSGWELRGADDLAYTFRPGVVLPGGPNKLYVTPDVALFRASQREQSGREQVGLFVQGGFSADLLAAGQPENGAPATLSLLRKGAAVATADPAVTQCSSP